MGSRTRLASVAAVVAVVASMVVTPDVGLGRARPAADVISPDFDGDGRADLAIGVPGKAVNGHARAGAVQVLYGTPDGPLGAGDEVWTQDSEGVPDRAESLDFFGWSIATGDFDGDGFDDLAVGSRKEDLGAVNTGSVTVIHGSVNGLTAVGSQRWSQGQDGIPDEVEKGDQWGYSILAADLDDDGFDELVVGTPFEDAPAENSGAIWVIRGSADGLVGTRATQWTQDSPWIPDTAEANDRFGWTLASADFDGDGFGDLAVGAPYESGKYNREGHVHIIHGSASGLTAVGTQYWGQDSPGVLETAWYREQFGQSLAAGDFDDDGFGDLAVGVWFEDHCWICNEGIVQVLYGSTSGLTAAGDQVWHQDKPGVLDTRDVGDQFGQTLDTGDLDGDGFDDLVIGVPWEDFTRGVSVDQGAVAVLYGSAIGLTATGNQLWSLASPGIPGDIAKHDHLGEALGVADLNGDGHADLVIGIPWRDDAAIDAGAVLLIRGSASGLTAHRSRLLNQNSQGIAGTAAASDQFGWSLSSGSPRTGTPRLCYGDVGGPC